MARHVEFHIANCGYRRWALASWLVDLPPDQEATAQYMAHALIWHDEDPVLAPLQAAESATREADAQLWDLCQRHLAFHPTMGNGSETWTARSAKDLARRYRFINERVTPETQAKVEHLWNETVVCNRHSVALQREYLRI